MSITALFRTLVDEMVADDVPDPLAQPCTLALVWADLARLAGESVPAEVAAHLDAPRPIRLILTAPKPPRWVCVVEPCEACGGPVGGRRPQRF